MCEFSDLSNDRVACYTWLGNISAASVFSEPFSYYTSDNLLRWHRCKYSRSRITKGKLINEKHNFCTEDIHRAVTALSRVNPQTPFLVRKKKKKNEEKCPFILIFILKSTCARRLHRRNVSRWLFWIFLFASDSVGFSWSFSVTWWLTGNIWVCSIQRRKIFY